MYIAILIMYQLYMYWPTKHVQGIKLIGDLTLSMQNNLDVLRKLLRGPLQVDIIILSKGTLSGRAKV